MHCGETLADIYEYCEDLGLGEALSEPSVHHVDDSASGAKLHEDEDFVDTVTRPMPGGVDEMDDVGMTFKDPLNGEDIETKTNDRRK